MEIGVDLTPDEIEFRDRARSWLTENVPGDLPSLDTAEGFEAHREWERTLFAGGWSAVAWPREYGGMGTTLIEWLLFEEEYYRAGAPTRVNQNGIFLLGPTLIEYGSDEQKERFLKAMACGDEVWCQGWSEPNAGSDMANIRARALRDGDEYVINGGKIWVSRGAYADWLFGLFRTDPESERHRGLSFLLVPMTAEGITVRPINQLEGQPGFAEVFFEDVRIPVENRIGGEGEGWKIAMATAGFERGLLLRSPGRFSAAARRLLDLVRAFDGPEKPALEERAIRSWMAAETYRLHTYWNVSRLLEGNSIGAEASLNKVFWSELDIALHETALEVLGADSILTDSPDSRWLSGYLFSLAGPIYAGSNEIQRNIVADRILELPRSR